MSREATRPTIPGCQSSPAVEHEGALLRRPELLVGFAQSLLKHLLFENLALAIEPVEFGGDGAGLDLVAEQQQSGAQRRVADAAARR